MARRAQAEENYWPGFVDALSTIVMVITFLLILLSIVIFVLSQNTGKLAADDSQAKSAAAKAMIESDPADGSQAEAQSKSPKQSPESALKMAQNESKPEPESKSASAAESRSKAKAQNQAKIKSQVKSQSPNKSRMKARQEKENANLTDGTFKPREGKRLTQAQKVESKTKLQVRSQNVMDEKRIVIAPEEKPGEQEKVKVESASSLLTLEFTQSNVKIDKASVQAVQSYISSNAQIKGGGKVEIRSFANSSVGSISEARRLAYYRAMSTRNQLLKSGVDPKRILIRVRETAAKDEQNLVKVFLKP